MLGKKTVFCDKNLFFMKIVLQHFSVTQKYVVRSRPIHNKILTRGIFHVQPFDMLHPQVFQKIWWILKESKCMNHMKGPALHTKFQPIPCKTDWNVSTHKSAYRESVPFKLQVFQYLLLKNDISLSCSCNVVVR